jgi:hypothetical protein
MVSVMPWADARRAPSAAGRCALLLAVSTAVTLATIGLAAGEHGRVPRIPLPIFVGEFA